MLYDLSTALASLAKGEGHTPPADVRAAARRGLALREKCGRGGLTTQEAGAQGIGSGVARARDLAAGSAVSTKTLKRMVSFFARHRANKSGGEDDAGHIAWLLWGGDPGEAWAKRELAGMEKGIEKGGVRPLKHDEIVAMLNGHGIKECPDCGTQWSRCRCRASHNIIKTRCPDCRLKRQSERRGGADAVPELEKGAAGNAPTYEAPPGAMRRVVVSGITCHVERMPGEVRHGRIIQNGYGYIPDTLDADDEPVDCYIGPNALAGLVYVIDQLDEDGDLDEHKVMLGFDSAEDAALAYASCLPRSRMGGMCSVLAGDFIMWLTRNPELDDEPFWAIAEGSNLRVGRFGAEYQPDAGRALIPASQQNPG